ncbi:TetR/AcrR family transcriptional regulator [Mycobacterium sp. Marseille-P9652]|uniref:TetR/AcrR family transcriptional regulator n=1 Tax=Mycobacterium sp. Marseille-P9652 TaxID=2654950 RepID=UPI0012E8FCE7|nr:helix-turn-helix domain-containing protein [Mycobacterium sp. Marseille-P9652]
MAPGEAREAGEAPADARIVRTRADVARTAFDVLIEEGSEALTHARVAERAGYSKTTLYKHWPAKSDLAAAALEALRDFQHYRPTGDTRADLIGELTTFRQAVLDLRLDLVLSAMAQWATLDAMRELRTEINAEGQRPIRTILERAFQGAELEAATSMLSGVVACPSLMFGTVPDDDVIEAAVDLVLRGAHRTP